MGLAQNGKPLGTTVFGNMFPFTKTGHPGHRAPFVGETKLRNVQAPIAPGFALPPQPSLQGLGATPIRGQTKGVIFTEKGLMSMAC